MRLIVVSALVSSVFVYSCSNVPNEVRSTLLTNKYIVKLKGDASTSSVDGLRASLQATSSHEYVMPGFRGFASTLTTEKVIRLQDSNQVRITSLHCVYID
jgi:cerevisin